MDVIVTYLSMYGYKSKRYVRMNKHVNRESTNLYVPCLLFECVLYETKAHDTRGKGKKIPRERNGKRQRKESDETNVEDLSPIRIHPRCCACNVSLKLVTSFFFIRDESGSNR